MNVIYLAGRGAGLACGKVARQNSRPRTPSLTPSLATHAGAPTKSSTRRYRSCPRRAASPASSPTTRRTSCRRARCRHRKSLSRTWMGSPWRARGRRAPSTARGDKRRACSSSPPRCGARAPLAAPLRARLALEGGRSRSWRSTRRSRRRSLGKSEACRRCRVY